MSCMTFLTMMEVKRGMEQDIRNHSGKKYIRPIKSAVNNDTIEIDVYCVLDAFEPGEVLAHAIKKLLCPGKREKGGYLQDLKEARDTITRAIQLEEGFGETELPRVEQPNWDDPKLKAWIEDFRRGRWQVEGSNVVWSKQFPVTGEILVLIAGPGLSTDTLGALAQSNNNRMVNPWDKDVVVYAEKNMADLRL